MKRNIHRAGRPAMYMSKDDCITLLNMYETHTTRELAETFRVSQATICNRLKKARAFMKQQEAISDRTQEETKSV